jgi:CP family cyanate transporter-like MFS transporter
VSRIQPPPAASSEKHGRLERTLLVIGVLALGYNLRGAITSLPPVFPELAGGLGLSSATISILAATPVICFGVVSGFGAGLARRAGEERVLLGAIIALTVGLVARGAAPGALLFPGTILLSAAIAVMNVLLSSLIKRRWPERAGFLIGLYITALAAGAIVASLVSVPLWNDTGGSVGLTLGWVAAPAALACLLWLPQLSPGGATPRTPPGARPMAKGAIVSGAHPAPPGGTTPRTPPGARPMAKGAIVSGAHPAPPGGTTPRTPRCPPEAGLIAKTAIVSGPPLADQGCGGTLAPAGDGCGETLPRADQSGETAVPARPARVAVHRHAITWYVTIFMGMQSLLYYATLSWLPTMLRDRGESATGAGDLLALMGVGNLAVSLLVPVAAQRMRSQVTLVVPTVMGIAGGLAALLYAPLGGAVAWALILGAGQNAALALAIFFTAARAPNAVTAASLSSLSQAVGYLLASAGPLEVGLLHSATGSWTAPVMVLFALSGVQLVAGILAARPGMLPATVKTPAETAAGTAGEASARSKEDE